MPGRHPKRRPVREGHVRGSSRRRRHRVKSAPDSVPCQAYWSRYPRHPHKEHRELRLRLLLGDHGAADGMMVRRCRRCARCSCPWRLGCRRGPGDGDGSGPALAAHRGKFRIDLVLSYLDRCPGSLPTGHIGAWIAPPAWATPAKGGSGRARCPPHSRSQTRRGCHAQ